MLIPLFRLMVLQKDLSENDADLMETNLFIKLYRFFFYGLSWKSRLNQRNSLRRRSQLTRGCHCFFRNLRFSPFLSLLLSLSPYLVTILSYVLNLPCNIQWGSIATIFNNHLECLSRSVHKMRKAEIEIKENILTLKILSSKVFDLSNFIQFNLKYVECFSFSYESILTSCQMRNKKTSIIGHVVLFIDNPLYLLNLLL